MSTSTADFAPNLHFWARNASNESALLHSALRLGLFRQLPVEGEGEPLTVEALAARVGATARGLRSILEPMTSFGVVKMGDDRRFALSSPVAAFLRQPDFQAALEEEARWWEVTGRLPEAVQSGEPISEQGRAWDVLGHFRQRLVEPAADPDPERARFFDRFARSYLRNQALITAGSTGLLERLGAGRAPLETLATAIHGSPHGTRTLLQTLAALGLAEESEGGWGFTPAAAAIFEGKGLSYFVRSLPISALYWEALGKLDQTLRDGTYVLDLKDPEVSKRFYSENSNQITGVFASHFQLARQAAITVAQARPLQGARVLDIGTGSGVWGAAFARTEPTAEVTYFDQEVVLAHVKANIEQLKLGAQARYWPGNLFAQDFGEAAFDLIVLPQVLNVLIPSDLPGMFRRVARALKPDGILVIAEYVLNERRDGPLDYLYFSFRRVVTNEGDLLSLGEYTALLAEVGLTTVKLFPLPTQEVILAARPGITLPQRLADPPARPTRAKATGS